MSLANDSCPRCGQQAVEVQECYPSAYTCANKHSWELVHEHLIMGNLHAEERRGDLKCPVCRRTPYAIWMTRPTNTGTIVTMLACTARHTW